MTPADEIAAAAQTLRQHPYLPAEMAPTPILAVLVRARLPLADLLDDQADGDDEGVVNPWALAVARAINGSEEQPA